MKPQLINDIIDIGKKIQEGKTVRTIDKMPSWNENVIDSWKEEAKNPEMNSEEWKSRF